MNMGLHLKRYILVLVFLATIVAKTLAQGHAPALSAGMENMTAQELWKKGNALVFEKNMPDSALVYYEAIVRRYADKEDIDGADREMAITGLNNSGYIYMFYRYDYTKALERLMRAMDLMDQPRTTLLLNLGNITGFYAQCFPTAENISLSHAFYRKAFDSACDDGEMRFAYNAFANLWNFGFDKDMIKKNADLMARFAQLKPQPDAPDYTYVRYLYNALCHIQDGDYLSALHELRKQYGVRDHNDDPRREMCQVTWSMVQVFGLSEQRDSLYRYAHRLKADAARFHLRDFQMDAADLLYNYFRMIGNNDSANAYQLEYFVRRDSLLFAHNLNNVKGDYFMHRLRNAMEQVDDLKQKRRVQLTIIMIMVLGIAVAVALLIVVNKKNRQLRQRNRVLYQHNIETLAAEEQERKRREQLECELKARATTDVPKPKYKGSTLDEDAKAMLKLRIEQVMTDSEAICHDNFTLEQLAQLCDSSYKNVSQVINESFGCSFSILLGRYRIKEICRRINDIDHYGHLTLEAIAAGMGLKARSSFFRTFKRETGLSPSEYHNLAKERYFKAKECLTL